ncbi:hypothetical protein P8S54_06900 [Thiomicrospira sp. R3]|uniref:hypothetical protein n=1 Tax=Thiomicrospira sp. R3 TaxID=3035472 RepID=UPI00259BBF53|nr:hypothetical protein [Thiomicrospira sp. R3]WFE67955.1 hypothetical protein P8S54_06900 [Thiomicrospira sp. R3]
MKKTFKAKANVQDILNTYLVNKNLDELKTLFTTYQTQAASAEREAKLAKKVSIAKGFATFNLNPQGNSNRYLTGIELDDQRAISSDWAAVGEDLSAAWLQTQTKEAL